MGLCINIASFFYIDNKLKDIEDINILIKILSITEEKEYTNKYIVKVIKCDNVCEVKNKKLILYTEKNMYFMPGDIVKVEGSFSKPQSKRNFGGFDYNKYLKQLKIFGTIQTDKCQKVGESKDIFTFFEKIRREFLNRIDGIYDIEEARFLKSLLFGKNDELSDNIKECFRDANISHILAISGMHVSYIIINLKKILDNVIKNKKFKNYILIFSLIIFSIFTGNSVSCIRACIMSGMVCLASNFEKKSNFYVSFIYSWIIIILYNPYNIYNIGLWLSYMGTLGIVLQSSFLNSLICHKLRRKKVKSKKKFKIIGIIIENFIVTISAQIFIFPIIMYVFNTVSFSFFVSNILISFFIGPILILGYINVFVSYIEIPIFKILFYIEEMLVSLIFLISNVCAKLPFSKIYVVTPSAGSVLGYYLIVVTILYKFHKRKIYMVKLCTSSKFARKEIKQFLTKIFEKINNFFKSKSIYLKKILKVFVLIVILLLYIYNQKGKKLEINFIDVGQGDCTYIKTPHDKNIIIDAGEGNSEKYDYGKNVVLPYLLDKKVKKIDYLIISHADSDHIGGVFAIIENIKVENIIIGIQPEKSKQYVDLLEIASRKNIEILEIFAGINLKIEENIFLQVLWPIKNKMIDENALNNNSLVFKFYYNNFSCLFTGDIEDIAEDEIVRQYYYSNLLKSNILKVSHHGSKTSTIDNFLILVRPQIALIGVGNNNKFGHPNKIVLERLEKIGSKIYRTDKNGEINILVNNKGKIVIKTRY